MDIQILSEDSLRLKIKKTTLVLNPRAKIAKTEADAILSTDSAFDSSRVTDYRVIINGMGDYEVSGLKIIATKVDNGLVFELISDTSDMMVASASSLAKMPTDRIKNYSVALINADAELPESVITAMEPRVLVLYGQNSKEAAKGMGKDTLPSSSKVSFSEDKLPEETAIYLLS